VAIDPSPLAGSGSAFHRRRGEQLYKNDRYDLYNTVPTAMTRVMPRLEALLMI
jgi:hypothetical protein